MCAIRHSFDGLVVDYASKNNATLLIRGLRAYSDWESELRMAILNRRLSSIETAFLMADEAHVHVSSTVIRELAKYNKIMEGFVPESICAEVYAKFGVRVPSSPHGTAPPQCLVRSDAGC